MAHASLAGMRAAPAERRTYTRAARVAQLTSPLTRPSRLDARRLRGGVVVRAAAWEWSCESESVHGNGLARGGRLTLTLALTTKVGSAWVGRGRASRDRAASRRRHVGLGLGLGLGLTLTQGDGTQALGRRAWRTRLEHVRCACAGGGVETRRCCRQRARRCSGLHAGTSAAWHTMSMSGWNACSDCGAHAAAMLGVCACMPRRSTPQDRRVSRVCVPWPRVCPR